MTKIKGFTCSCCGKYHEDLPISFGNPAPVYYYNDAPEEREDRFELDDDLCIMDNEHFFIRGCIGIPKNLTEPTKETEWGRGNFEKK
jgi:hypothetical protein